MRASWREVLRFCTRPARSAFSSPSSGAGRLRAGSVFFDGLTLKLKTVLFNFDDF